MTKYGSTTTMQQLAWGGAKAVLPDRVTAVQNQITSLINIVLNRTEDYTTVPEEVNQIANTVASELLRPAQEKPMSQKEIFEWLQILLFNYRDQAPTGETNWGNIKIIHG